jgi:hypothetical protein
MEPCSSNSGGGYGSSNHNSDHPLLEVPQLLSIVKGLDNTY